MRGQNKMRKGRRQKHRTSMKKGSRSCAAGTERKRTRSGRCAITHKTSHTHRSRPRMLRAPSLPAACPLYSNAVRIAQDVLH
eukprot:2166007-Pyramimonas_sp.AAC.1